MPDTRKNTLRLIAEAAVASERATRCPAELQAAQCILETGWLKHAPGNNCFGIKYYDGADGRQLLNTREWLTDAEAARFLGQGGGRTAILVDPVKEDRGRKLYNCADWFATFATLGDCFACRARMFHSGRYAPFAQKLREGGSLDTLVRDIAPIYATDPTYADRLLELIHNPEIATALATARDEAKAREKAKAQEEKP